MADTRQVVSWALERPCRFRHGEQWMLPGPTARQLADLRTVADAGADGRVVDGICVTGWTTGEDYAGTAHDIPSSGFRVAERLAPVGGLETVTATCHGCEANAPTGHGLAVAGCYGHLDVRPASEELDRQLRAVIAERNLEDRLRAAFPVTTPLWYGFWINTPLRQPQAEFLHELLTAVCDPADPRDDGVRHFLAALAAAVRWELPVHVSLAPLGHTDFGWYTVFPHCPRCRATAPVGRWQESYPTDPLDCRVCGHTFVPNDHHRSERDDHDWQVDHLKTQLGADGYEPFVRAFLAHRGCSPAQVDEVIDTNNNGPLLRRIRATREQREATLRLIRAAPTESPALSFALADGVELELVHIPAGEFLMGSPDPDANATEAPQHRVRIARPFAIGRYPVTQAQWTAVMGTTRSRHRGDPRLPVDRVSWFDAQEFCERLCRRLGRVFRLPTEAEWEYACRAGTTTRYAFGDELRPTQANFTPADSMFGPPPADAEELVRGLERAAEDAPSRRAAVPTPVGSYPPNGWGACDMHGNVDEWCEDVWHPGYAGAPADGSAWLDDEATNPFRVMRGGWASASEFVCTSAARRQLRADAGSHDTDEDESEFSAALVAMFYTPYGFRVVCEVAPTPSPRL